MSSLLFVVNLRAAIIKHEVPRAQYREFEYAEVCELMGTKDAILISPKSLREIECFNKRYQLIDFCLKKLPEEKKITRGYINSAGKKVICEMADNVSLNLSCDQRDIKFCRDPKKGCEALRKIYAIQLETAHFSMLEKKLNCHFSKRIGESLNEI